MSENIAQDIATLQALVTRLEFDTTQRLNGVRDEVDEVSKNVHAIMADTSADRAIAELVEWLKGDCETVKASIYRLAAQLTRVVGHLQAMS